MGSQRPPGIRRPVALAGVALLVGFAVALPAWAAPDDVDLVSRASDGTAADDDSAAPDVSADGRHVGFSTLADNLSAEDVDAVRNIFVRDLTAGTTTLVSRADGAAGAGGDADSLAGEISADGRYFVFYSGATNLSAEDVDPVDDVFVRDLVAQTTTLASRADGAAGAAGDADSVNVTMSGSGRRVAFQSSADNLAADDNDAVSNVFVRDLDTNTTIFASRAPGAGGAPADAAASFPSLSDDGRHVAFSSGADNLSAEDDDTVANVYVRDLVANTTTLVSRATGAGGAGGNGTSTDPSVSADGRYVAFHSQADNLSTEDDDTVFNIFVRDLVAGTTTLVSRAPGPAGAGGDASSLNAVISADGTRVAFRSLADNLSAEDDGAVEDVFVRDLVDGTTTLVSRAAGATGAGGDGNSSSASVSADGSHVAFISTAANLSDLDVDSATDVFRRGLAPRAAAPPVAAAATAASDLCATVAPARTSGGGGRITLSVAQLKINQRIGQAAIRRLNAIQAWLDAGIEGRDVCGGALGPDDLTAGATTQPEPTSLAALTRADPREIVVAAARPDPNARFTLSAEQLLINQRIYQAATRRANALRERLDQGLTGGDVDNGTLGRGVLHDRLRILALPAATPVAKTVTSIAARSGGDPGAVRLNAAQLAINQKVAQAAVRRANALTTDLSSGLTGADFRNGSIGTADLAAGVIG
ncbi:MAG: TolB family protein [Thermoleophilia bacterium]